VKIPAPRHFLMRVVRDGPLVPAMLFWSDADPADPSNKLDRGRLVPYPRAAIAGEEVPPEQLLVRLINPYSGDQAALPHQVLDRLANHLELPPPTHWRYTQSISEAEYDHHFKHLRWAERNDRNNAALRPRERVDPRQMPLPSFERENAYR
jgi:hypothetical protein